MLNTTLSTHLYAPLADLWDWQLHAACRNHAQIVGEPFGIWCGTTESDRRSHVLVRTASLPRQRNPPGQRPGLRRLTFSRSHPRPGGTNHLA
ncbi:MULTISPECIES: WhiB family transcriptional regulator [Rhodococcus]|uniref:Putative WhiB family regulatory protein n=1 Tax=Rhodococcus wratislaviensis NBRC 100605 TaxID=1219028 RepID=X0PUX8_RHOWR|nr:MULTISPECIES: WhiB family transcriptional regulator [Rhodococcus]GAF47014.1 putative WhiB family regulatory protein [Rhodococcus wratislaviensis NBRC 100605]